MAGENLAVGEAEVNTLTDNTVTMLAAQLAETQGLLQEQTGASAACFAAFLTRLPGPGQATAGTLHVDRSSDAMVFKVDEFLKVHMLVTTLRQPTSGQITGILTIPWDTTNKCWQMLRGAGKICKTLEKFTRILHTRFYPAHLQKTAEAIMKRLVFTNSILEYTAKFNTLWAQIGTLDDKEQLTPRQERNYFLNRFLTNPVSQHIQDNCYKAIMNNNGTEIPITELQKEALLCYKIQGCVDDLAKVTPNGRQRQYAQLAQVHQGHHRAQQWDATCPTAQTVPHKVQTPTNALPIASASSSTNDETFTVHRKVQGRFARVLIATGCNTLITSNNWAATHCLRTSTSKTPLVVRWGDTAGNYREMKMTCGNISVFTEEKVAYRKETVPFVVAPIRVDVILGLPFILALDIRGLFDQEGFPTMTFYHDGQILNLRAKPTNRHWEAPSACATRLLSPREVRSRRFQPARPALNAEEIYMAKQWKRLMKKGEITGVFEVHIVDAIPVVEAQFVRTVDAKKRAILEERCHTHAEAKATDQEDPLEALAADHPLRPTLEKYITTLFTKQSGMPPDRGEDNFTIRLKPGSKPVMQPLRHLSPDELDELGQQMQRLMDKGWISHSRSLWGAPVLFCPKKDGELRCCIDYRALNKMTHKDAKPLPNLSELHDRLVNMRVFTAIDIRD
ncbi:hypothetical protein PhCBS80983_g06267, partial [Powellomyces hirtus]